MRCRDCYTKSFTYEFCCSRRMLLSMKFVHTHSKGDFKCIFSSLNETKWSQESILFNVEHTISIWLCEPSMKAICFIHLSGVTLAAYKLSSNSYIFRDFLTTNKNDCKHSASNILWIKRNLSTIHMVYNCIAHIHNE